MAVRSGADAQAKLPAVQHRVALELQLAQQRVERVLRIDGAKPTDEVGQCFAVRVQIGLQELLVLVGEIRDLEVAEIAFEFIS